ncbi:uncharacterized protein H6S33_006995, partial [Morchella sextelata]|uniref:uncharacterized protein n=1 Tax=Morchella sextelata TaxID=1174677 RepID=UPI001D0584AE
MRLLCIHDNPSIATPRCHNLQRYLIITPGHRVAAKTCGGILLVPLQEGFYAGLVA